MSGRADQGVHVSSKQVWSVVGGLAATGAGILGKKAAHSGWRKVTGKEPPANPESRETTWAEALGFAVASGAVMGIARLLGRRFAAGAWERVTGALPPGLETVD